MKVSVKTIFALTVALAMLVLAVPSMATAGDTAKFGLTVWNWNCTEMIDPSTLQVGDYFKVGFTFTEIAAQKFRAGDVTLYFDNTKLQLVNASTRADVSQGSKCFAPRHDFDDYFNTLQAVSSQANGRVAYALYIDFVKMEDYLIDPENWIYDLPPELGYDGIHYYNCPDGTFTMVYLCFKVKDLGNAGFLVGNENTGIPGYEILKAKFADENTDWHDIDSSSVANNPIILGNPEPPTPTLVSVENPADKTVPWGTALENIGLPATVTGTYSDGSTGEISVVEWTSSPAYNMNTPGEYIFTATLADTELTATCKVTVEQRPAPVIVDLIDPDPIDVPWGTAIENIGLPETVTAVYDYGDPAEVPVSWSCNSYNPNVAGQYVFTGTVEGTEQTAELIVNVADTFYTITVNVTGSGTVTPSLGIVSASTKTIAFTIVPDEGWVIDKAIFNCTDVTDQMIGNTLSLTNVTADGILCVAFRESDAMPTIDPSFITVINADDDSELNRGEPETDQKGKVITNQSLTLGRVIKGSSNYTYEFGIQFSPDEGFTDGSIYYKANKATEEGYFGVRLYGNSLAGIRYYVRTYVKCIETGEYSYGEVRTIDNTGV